jgi:hypothetical protein
MKTHRESQLDSRTPVTPGLLFVSGDGKTGTSSMVGMLNSHPDIFVMYEAEPNQVGGPLRRGAEFLERYPAARPLFTSTRDWTAPYRGIAALLAELGHSYRYFGDKVLSDSMTEEQAKQMGAAPVIYLVRNLRTWLCKNIVVDYYVREVGVAECAVKYVDNLLRSFLLPRVLRISMEEMIHHNHAVLVRLGEFLQLPLLPQAKKWWNQVGEYEAGDPKGAVIWWKGHDSSMLRPRVEDTHAELRPNRFWEKILPIFDRYYGDLRATHDPVQIQRDRQALREILPCSVQHTDIYKSVESVSFGTGILGAFGHRSSNVDTKPFTIG